MAEEVDILAWLHRVYSSRCPYKSYKEAIVRLNDAELSGDGERIDDALAVIEEFRLNRKRKPASS